MILNFKKVSIKMASSSKISSWSFGEVKNSSFVNFKNLKPELNSLFCLKIFSDYELCCLKKKCFCYNDKFLNLKKAHTGYKVGHIKLFYPVVHIWYIKSTYSSISNILKLNYKIIEKIINFKLKIAIKSYEKKIKKFSLFLFEKKIKNIVFTLSGAKALKKLLSDRELFIDCLILNIKIKNCNLFNKIFSILKYINKVLIFYYSGNKPSWMVLKKIPVIPPRMRPLIPLNNNKFASSDINELYKIVIDRNNRLKNLIDCFNSKQLLINERILLQESVYALFDNEKLKNPIYTSSKRILKSFSNSIKGKYGRFRQNLLGKRVDFSGRTVITVDPYLFLYECKIPIFIALELFKPFLYYELKKKNIITSISFIDDYYKKNKKKIILLLKNIVKNYSVMLNRAPTLHRMNFQSFRILLTEEKTIKIHPFVCLSYNADFDGDQMAIHLPLTTNAKIESDFLLSSINNIISPSNGEAIIIPTQDVVMGLYYFTFNFYTKSVFLNNVNDVFKLFEFNNYNFQINVKFLNKKVLNTTVGRIIINYLFFENLNNFLNIVFKKKILSYLIKYLFDFNCLKKLINILEKLKKIGFLISTYSGITISYSDLVDIKNTFLINKIIFKLKYNNNIFFIVELLNRLFVNIIIKNIQINKFLNINKVNNLFIMLDSGSRGTMLQVKQLIAFRGFFSKSNGDIINNPIFDNLRNGLNMKNYFISTFGARKGLTDTSLKTANSGYLTRKLIDVSHDLVIYKINCESKTGIKIFINSYNNLSKLYKNLYGRVLLNSVFLKNKILIKKNTLINNKILFLILKKNINVIFIRSVLFCISNRGICCYCYGIDLSTNKLVIIGVPVGIISAQSIGEPGTQLTMRTFHTGGVASYFFYSDNLIINNSGFIKLKNCKCVINKFGELIICSLYGEFNIYNKFLLEKYKFYYGTKIKFRNGFLIKKNTKLINFNDSNFYIFSESIGYATFSKNNVVKKYCLEDNKFYYTTFKKIKITILNKKKKKNYYIPKNFNIIILNNDYILPGEIIAKLIIITKLKSSIIGGLPRLSELFEARIPKLKALLSEIDGICKIKILNLNYIITIFSKFGFYKEYTLSFLRKLYVNNGDYVKIGDILSDGKPDLNEIINLISIDYLLFFFINEINLIYQPQNIYINNKHIELILKQMTKKVKIIFSGDCSCQQDDILFIEDAINDNFSTLIDSRRLSFYKRIVTGITKTSLESLSFFSAASFQETNRILVNSAIKNRTDYLLGLKENVLVGKLIPAGTGLIEYFKKNSTIDKNKLDYLNRKNFFLV
ncbi:DNA-directed RNA polymerase subunit beta' [Candidatus Carsonella ruddii]|uniref:DNA-directed RNA polymerase subunit beta' n=1 Tax=Candidatus Carsonella ruddii PC isolate NHV TaxID=1202540 RepID=J3YQZ0_CARRU|nr:DNA-directed RNA polymerase subunit beta' [Candidatus Carsonella ruddii]AFP84388.1 RNA polymerase beta' subunit [Candidatus Carsonella ruddii PC isolate NHV]